jgi:predicted enzyme involved in methoxymalonyl-ACP biosynthesis
VRTSEDRSNDLPRIAQLIGKTNQFNLTTRRHGAPELRRFMADNSCVHRSLRLRDRFTDHGLEPVSIDRVGPPDRFATDPWLAEFRTAVG